MTVDKYPKRLHQITAQIEVIEVVVMRKSQLSEISACDYFAIESREYYRITVIQCRIDYAAVTAPEIFAENCAKIYFCSVSFTVGSISGLQLIYISSKQSGRIGLTFVRQKVRLIFYLLPDNIRPDLPANFRIPADLFPQFAGGLKVTVTWYQL